MLQGGPESATTWLVFGNTARVMTDVSDILLDDVDALRAQLTAPRLLTMPLLSPSVTPPLASVMRSAPNVTS
jgi:hypothetical protein